MRSRRFACAMTEECDRKLRAHLIRRDDQEDICFALYRPSAGQDRDTAIVYDVVLPEAGDRLVHGNASYMPQFFLRAAERARNEGAGLTIAHSHPGGIGWQGMSRDDVRAEERIAAQAWAITSRPLVGLTSGSTSWSARRWSRVGPRQYERQFAEITRVVGDRLTLTSCPELFAAWQTSAELERTVAVFGREAHFQVATARIGIVGAGNVGSAVIEALARMGCGRLRLIEFDLIEPRNLDRTIGATRSDVGRKKSEVARENAMRSDPLGKIDVDVFDGSITTFEGVLAALDCDLIFSCVDKHWPRRVLNHIAYAHLIPVIDGGILVRVKGDRMVGADWHVRTVAAGRRCLECWDAYDPSMVALEISGLLDNPSYIKQLGIGASIVRSENVFPFGMSVASLEVLQMRALLAGPIANLGDQNYHATTGGLDITPDVGCVHGCLFPPITSLGDAACINLPSANPEEKAS